MLIWRTFFVLAIFFAVFAHGSGNNKTLVILGDSLTEGYGVAQERAYPALLEKRLQGLGKKWQVVNSGISGSTSASASGRVRWILKSKPSALLIAIGANDGLRGRNPKDLRKDLEEAVKLAKASKVSVAIAGMEMPVNYGKEYRDAFREVFRNVAKAEKVPLVPFLLEGVGGKPEMNLADGIHPNEKGHEKIAENVLLALKDWL